jgi:alpha-N-arabinofuranosidase
LDLEISAGTKDSALFKNLPMADAVATVDSQTGQITVFLLNRELEDSSEFNIELAGLGSLKFIEALQLGGENLELTNNADRPAAVEPKPVNAVVSGEHLNITVPKSSWTMVRLEQIR